MMTIIKDCETRSSPWHPNPSHQPKEKKDNMIELMSPMNVG